jgi:catechol 2,3-dioxygenase-like lactoylglutathione lyase family enzyme
VLVEDPDALGIHHVELHVPNPEQTLQWYVHAFGGDRTKYKGQVEAVRYHLGVFFLFAVQDAGARR